MPKEETKEKSSVHPLGTASLILGILSIVLILIPVVNFILALLAIIFGIIGIIKYERKGTSIAGLIMGCIGLIIIIFITIFLIKGFGEIATLMQNANNTASFKEYKMNEPFVLEGVQFNVKKLTQKSEIGSANQKTTANGIFYILEVNIENKGNETKSTFGQNMQLIDNKGRKFSSSSQAEQYASLENLKSLSSQSQLQPGLPITGVKIFDLPKDASTLQVEISCCGFFMQKTARVNLTKS